jgi:hypothetical protein
MDPLPEMLKGHTVFVKITREGHLCVTGTSYGTNMFTLTSKCVTSNIYFVILLNKLFVLALLNCLSTL